MRREVPTFTVVSKLVARALGITPGVLQDSFRVASAADLPAILELRRNAYGAGLTWDDSSYVRWRYTPGAPDGFGKMFILRIGERLAGVVGAECVRLHHGNVCTNAMSLMDLLVDASLEDTGLGVWLNMAVFERCPLIFEIGANANSIGVIDRLYRRLPNRICYSYPLHLRNYLQRRIGISWLAAAVAAPLNAFLYATRLFTFPTTKSRWEFRNIQRFDDTVMSLFGERDGADICVERSSGWLNWRLFDNPRTRFDVIGAYAGEKLEGYIAFHRRAGDQKAPTIEIVDCLVSRQYGSKLMRRLLGEVVRRAVAGNAEFVRATILGASMGRLLRTLGFVPQTNEYLTTGVHVASQSDFGDLYDGSRWFLTDANTDIDRA